MMNPILSLERDLPPADDDQRQVAEAFREYEKVIVEAPPGTGKTFLGVYLALCSLLWQWTSPKRPALFLTFSRNARVRIEREIARFQQESWITREETRAVRVSNYHAFYLGVLRRKAGLWGCTQTLRPASILERQQRLDILLSEAGVDETHLSTATSQAGLAFALRRFNLHDLMGFDTPLMLDERLLRMACNDAIVALREGRPHYNDFAPLFLNLLEYCPELVHWLRLSHPVVILDEFQDTDAIQWEIIRRIHPERLIILLDRYQMIYEWRGARPDRIGQVKQEFDIPDQAERGLTRIHRVGNEANLARFIQQLRSDDLRGDTVVRGNGEGWLTIYPVRRWTSVPPAQWTRISDEAKCLQTIRQGRFVSFGEATAILTRTNYLAEYLYTRLRLRKQGSQHFRCRWIGSDNNPDEMIRDHIWRLRQVNDSLRLRAWCGRLLDGLIPAPLLGNLSFEDEFACGSGEDILRRRRRAVLRAVRQTLMPWWDTVNLGNNPALARALRTIPDLAELMLEASGFPDPDALYYIRELAEAAEVYVDSNNSLNWSGFCDHLEDRLVRSAFLRLRSSLRGLHILTVHQSKGREFDHVIIPWLSGRGEPCTNRMGQVFPRSYDYDEFEDRRLLYVGFTRARRHVTVIYPEEDPSPFIARWRLG